MKRILIILPFFLMSLLMNAQNSDVTGISVVSHRFNRIGEELVLSMNIEVSRRMKTNESIILTPELRDDNGNYVQFPNLHINGRNQQIYFERETARKVKKARGYKRDNKKNQTFHYLYSVPFSAWMNKAEFKLLQQDCGCGVPIKTKLSAIDQLSLGTKAISPRMAFIQPNIEDVKGRVEKGVACLNFPLNEVIIYPEYHANGTELQKIKTSIDLVQNDHNVTIDSINLHGYASPEGPYENNVRLARERVSALKDYICSQSECTDEMVTIDFTPEDWEGLEILLTDTIIPNRDKILSIVQNDNLDPDRKEAKLRKKFPEEFNFMAQNWMPYLRHSDYVINYTVRPFSVEEAKEVFRTQPKNLSLEEMYRIAMTYEVGSPEYNQVFMTAVLLNPDDPIANHNAACIMLMQGQTDAAEHYLKKGPDGPQKTLAEGVLHLLRQEYENAIAKFKEAEEAGLPEAEENLKLLIY